MKILFMHEHKKIAPKYSFLSAGSGTAEQIRNYPWETTTLGTPDHWPATLRASVSTLLRSATPMYLLWGEEHIQFFNDAFLALGPDKELAIGAPSPDKFHTGNFSAEINVKGRKFFEFAIIYDENNQAAGLLGTPAAGAAKREYESLFYELVDHAPFGIAILKGDEFVFEISNEKYNEIIDRSGMSLQGKALLEVLPELRNQGIAELLANVLRTGEPYIGNEYEVELLRNGRKEKVYYNFLYNPYQTKDGSKGVMVVATDVSDLVRSRHTLEDSETQLRNVIMQSPIPVTIFRTEDFVIEMANRVMFEEIWRKKPEEVLGRKLIDVFPELAGQKYPELLKQVWKSGTTHSENESAAMVGDKLFYLDFEYAPLFDNEGSVSGVLVTVNDVTEKVNTRKKIQESETRQKIAIESAEIGTFDWDIIHSEFIYSDRLAQIFGFNDPKGLLHNHFTKLIHPDDVELRLKAHKESFKTGKLFYEARFLIPGQVWLRVSGKVFFDEKGTPQRIYGTVLDITSHKEKTYELEIKVKQHTRELILKNEELKRSEERYHRMTDEVQDYAILLLSPEGTILNWNQGARKIKGYNEEEIVGKHISIFYLQEDRHNQIPQKIISEAREHGRTVHEGWRVRKDDSIFWASTVVTALHDEKNNIIGFTKVTRDLTERKIAEDRLRQYMSELEFQNKELEQFAYVASHDLQEPLRKIQTFSSMLQNNLGKDSAELYLEKIKSSAQRMTELIKAVLNYSKLSSATTDKQKVDLNKLIENIKIDFELLIEEKKATIVYDQLPEIHGIPLQLTQLFSNLIGNSLKFADKAPVIRIEWRFISDQELLKYPNLQTGLQYIELVFSDNGIGFEKQYAGQIFNMFQRLHDKQTYSGTGIGLALCKRIVENHHGYITASSEPGQGARFSIYLPL